LEQLWAERERQDEEIEKVWSRWIFSRPTILPCLQAVEDEKQKLVDEAASEVAAMAKCVEEASRLEAEVRRDSFPHLVHILYSCPFNDSEAQNKSELARQQILFFFSFFLRARNMQYFLCNSLASLHKLRYFFLDGFNCGKCRGTEVT
jgi:hypothetical protein